MKTVFLIILTAIGFTAAAERRIELPRDTPEIKPGKGSEAFAASCLICHSTEYISTQPKMPRKFWEGVVIKMKDKFGAPVDPASIEELTDYLTTNYGK